MNSKKRLGKTFRKRLKMKKKIQDALPIALDKLRLERVQMVELKKFLKLKGKKKDKSVANLNVCNFIDTGRGLKAMETIHSFHTIMQIPEKALITCQNVISDEFIRLSIGNNKLRSLDILSLFVLLHSCLNEESPWKEYISTLPDSYTVLSYCHPKEIAKLPKFLRDKADQIEQKIESSFTILSDIWSKLALKLNISGNLSKEKAKWAYFTVNSRCIYLQGTKLPQIKDENNMALAPYLDLLNHSAYAIVECGMNKSNRCYEIKTKVPYRKYDQVFINYGPHSNFSLLIDYGFVLENNPNDYVEVEFNDIVCLIPGIEEIPLERKTNLYKKKKIIEQNFKSSLSFSIVGPSWNLEMLFAILLMTEYELAKWKMIYQNVNNLKISRFTKFLMNALINEKIKEYKNVINILTNEETVSLSLKNVFSLLQNYCNILSTCLQL